MVPGQQVVVSVGPRVEEPSAAIVVLAPLVGFSDNLTPPRPARRRAAGGRLVQKSPQSRGLTHTHKQLHIHTHTKKTNTYTRTEREGGKDDKTAERGEGV